MKLSRKSSSLVAVVLLAGLSLTACGDKDSSDGGSKPAASSSAKSGGGDLTEANFVDTLTAAQVKASSAHVTMDIGVGGQSIKATGDQKVGKTFADTAMSLSMDMGAAGMDQIKMVLADQTFYLNFGKMTQDKYAKIDLKDDSNPLGKQFSQLVDQMDPSKQLEQFKKALTSFDKKGAPQDIDGVKAQPYEIVLDTSKIAALSDLPGGATAGVPKTLTYTMFVGPDDLLRRIVTDAAGSKVTVDYSKWGEPVDIKAPAAGEISDQDLSKLMGGATPS
jgi:hypothetical protein